MLGAVFFRREQRSRKRSDRIKVPAFILAVVLSALWLTGPVSSTHAAENWTAVLQPPADERGYNASEVLIIELPAHLADRSGNFLSLEVDNVDVSQLITIEGGYVSYQPYEPFTAGAHELRLFEISDDGSYTERSLIGFQTFAGDIGADGGGAMMSGDTGAGGSRFYADNSLEVIHRLADKYVTTTAEDTTISGSGNMGYSNSGARWQVEAGSNYFIESEEDLSMSGRRVDIGEYNFSADYQGDAIKGGTKIGHHDVGVDSFVMSGFNRRGISASAGTAGDSASATAFSFAADSIVGAADIVGSAENSGHVQGGLIGFRPMNNADGRIEISGVYFTAEGGIDSIAVSGDELDPATPAEGHGGALVVDSYWADERLRLRGEYAHSYNDVDGDGSLNEDSAGAGSILVSYALIENEIWGDDPVSLTIGGKWEYVETYFSSIANPGMAADRDSWSAFADFFLGNLSLNARTLVETNNVDDVAGVATDRITNSGFDGNYSFNIERENPEDLAWLGMPYMSFGMNGTTANRVDTPSGYQGAGTDNYSVMGYFSFGSSYDRWNWQLGYNRTLFEDDANQSSDTTNDMIDLSATWSVNDDLNLTAGTQFIRFEDVSEDKDSYMVGGNFGLQATLIPETLRTSWNYNMNLSAGSGDSPNTHLVSGEVEWTLIPAQTNRVGVALALRGSMEKEHGNDDDGLDDLRFETFAALRFTAPVSR